jgi:hypothetical protein
MHVYAEVERGGQNDECRLVQTNGKWQGLPSQALDWCLLSVWHGTMPSHFVSDVISIFASLPDTKIFLGSGGGGGKF